MQQKVASGEIPPQVVQQMKQKMGNQQVEVKQAKFKTIVSEGSSLQGSQIASAVLTGMGDNINAQITKQSLETLTSQNVKVNAADINGLTNPVKVDNENLIKLKITKQVVMHHSNVYANLDRFNRNVYLIVLCI